MAADEILFYIKEEGALMYIVDLHIHSRYSRATSKDCTPEFLDLWARRKGIGIVGSGDFTHPAWREELREKLEPAEDGLYTLKKEYRIEDSTAAESMQPRFVITGEISSIYKKYDRVRKVHSLILLPGLDEAEIISRKLEAIGNIHSDGRPILGLDCHDLLEILLELCPRAVYVPAHIWTPHFSLFGAFSGFDSVEECYGDLSPYIHAMETGLSSDPPMNWRVSALDGYQLISNSDAHSPAKLGREANLLDIELSYDGLKEAIQTGAGLSGTIEFFPEEGKYHYDGHRKCNLCLTPLETEKYNGICPVCGRKLTIGVSHRIEQLADRPEGSIRDRLHFESLVPLPEVIGAALGHSSASAKVQKEYMNLLGRLGSEFRILRELPLEDIRSTSGVLISEGIRKLRKGEVERIPGFDGAYGEIRLFTQSELDAMDGQLSLFPGNLFSEADSLENPHTLQAGQEQTDNRLVLEKKGLDPAQSFIEGTGRRTHSTKESGSGVVKGAGMKAVQKILLNEKQQQAVRSIERVTAVVAGPGTGKTKTLVSRIVYLLETRRVKPSNITAVTFTNQAAGELRMRIKEQLGRGAAAKKIQIGTFHSIARKLLKEKGIEFSLVGEMETKEIVDKIIKEFDLEIGRKEFLTELSHYKTGQGQKAFSGPETDNAGTGTDASLHSQQAASESTDRLFQAFEAYQKFLKEKNAMDFDDLLTEALRVAREPEVESQRKDGAGPFDYLLVDEFQDISPLQYQLIRTWNQRGKELFVIGDPDQAIYGFRGADAGCFERLLEEFPQTMQITLEENYRSTPQILDLAVHVISKNPGGERRLRANTPGGAAVRIVEADTEMSEAIFVAKEVNRIAGGIGMLEAQEVYVENESRVRGFDEIAVLYRTRRQADLLEKCLKKEGIPYIVAGREDFLLEPAVRGTASFFKSLLDPQDGLAGQTALRLLWDLEAGDMTASIYENMREKYMPLLKKKKPQKILDEWMEDLQLGQKKGMQKLYRTSVFYQTMAEFTQALDMGVESDLKRCGEKQYTSGAVTLMTLHGSKGLEFPVVMIYGANKGRIPFKSEKYVSDEEEERRLFYVGLTRAREELILTTSKEESPFLEEIPGELANREKAHGGKSTGGARQMSLFDFI